MGSILRRVYVRYWGGGRGGHRKRAGWVLPCTLLGYFSHPSTSLAFSSSRAIKQPITAM